MRSRLAGRHGRMVVLVAALGLTTALAGGSTTVGAATPSEATVSPRDATAAWEGEHYAVGSTLFAHTACRLPTALLKQALCDRFDLTVDVEDTHWDTHTGGVEITIRWASDADDFDLHVFAPDGTEVGHSVGAGTTSERVLVEDPKRGTYAVRVNPYRVTDSGYSGAVRLHSRQAPGRTSDGVPEQPVSDLACTDGMAGPFPCDGVDLESFLPHDTIGGGQGNDIWGWTDATTGREYALVGQTDGTAFVDVTVPNAPVYLGKLPSHQPIETLFNVWRDVKVYADHAYVVSEEPLHGMQVFDLARLRGVTRPRTWTEDAHYPLFGGAHNVAINEDTGFAYAVGTATCLGGPHVVDVRNPTLPLPAGCVLGDGYTHDAQCVTYEGPDVRFTGRELCFNSNEDTLTIVDMTHKLFPVQLSRTSYEGAAYSHQGWLTEDQSYFLLGDELDEVESGVNTTTYIFDVSDLTAPVLRGAHQAATEAIDHNLYVRGSLVYQANYRAGLRILDLGQVASGRLREVAYFDVYPADDAAEFNGAWSSYPFFDSGVVVVNGIEQGLFVVRPR